MEAINFIKQYHKLYIGNIDYSILDNNKNSYFYYETILNVLTNNFNYITNEEIIFNNNFKQNFLILSINDNNIKIQQLYSIPYLLKYYDMNKNINILKNIII